MDALGWIAERLALFLSIQAQDFIEDGGMNHFLSHTLTFLSIQAQDFIEDPATSRSPRIYS